MTVKELKTALRGVPDDVPVKILIDSWESRSEDAWMAHYDTETDEDGNETEEFTINC
jgi:hypothetical protein